MIHFVSYGDDRYRRSKRRIAGEARRMGFDTVTIHGPEMLPADFVRATEPYIREARGAGFWLWKPWLLKHTCDAIADGDVLVYADAGCQLDWRARRRLDEYVALADREGGVASFRLVGFPEHRYTTRAVFESLGVPAGDPIRTSDQWLATFLVARKTRKATALFDAFHDVAVRRPDLFSDRHDGGENGPEFVAHRHDQSIFSVLRKQAGGAAIPDESWAADWSLAVVAPIRARRWRQRHVMHELRDRCQDALSALGSRMRRL